MCMMWVDEPIWANERLPSRSVELAERDTVPLRELKPVFVGVDAISTQSLKETLWRWSGGHYGLSWNHSHICTSVKVLLWLVAQILGFPSVVGHQSWMKIMAASTTKTVCYETQGSTRLGSCLLCSAKLVPHKKWVKWIHLLQGSSPF